jgi:phosphatidate cytidylyltransferase
MLRDRLVVILILLPTGIGVLLAGGAVYTVLCIVLAGMASAEYARLFSTPERPVPAAVLAVGCAVLVAVRGFWGFDHMGITLCGIIFLSLAWFLFRYEREGEDRSATAMSVVLGGTLYLGWLMAYFVSLRQLPFGFWWTLLCLAGVGAADSSAYLIGKRWGSHPLAPRISPKKTWEGYLGGVFGATLAGVAMGWLLQFPAGAASGIIPAKGAILGALIGILAPLGDLAVSMIKREMARKDSGDFFPGHGGVLDRIDSWLVMAVVGYYTIAVLFPVLPFR